MLRPSPLMIICLQENWAARCIIGKAVHGLTLDVHIYKMLKKWRNRVSAHSGLMPNIRASQKRAIMSVAQPQILYAAPAWHIVTGNRKLIAKPASIQRNMCINFFLHTRRSPRLELVPPIDLLVLEKREKYKGTSGATAVASLMTLCQAMWNNSEYRR
ncbi:hypothetical protein JTB14_014695 [Gonioctena quinquepunctata]|nr:hypothetical protein JTB14_014695 [Gonioctena quinquepunctata]